MPIAAATQTLSNHAPKQANAMRHRQISYSKVRAVTRVATPENERRLLNFALSAPASYVGGWPAPGAGWTGRRRRPTSSGGTSGGT